MREIIVCSFIECLPVLYSSFYSWKIFALQNLRFSNSMTHQKVFYFDAVKCSPGMIWSTNTSSYLFTSQCGLFSPDQVQGLEPGLIIHWMWIISIFKYIFSCPSKNFMRIICIEIFFKHFEPWIKILRFTIFIHIWYAIQFVW